MTSKINLRMTHLLLAAGLAFGAAAAHAASGVSITQAQETRVAVGMTAAEVQQNLGRPANIEKYPYAPGPTWTYEVAGTPFGQTDFNIDFGSDGKVASLGENVLGDN